MEQREKVLMLLTWLEFYISPLQCVRIDFQAISDTVDVSEIVVENKNSHLNWIDQGFSGIFNRISPQNLTITLSKRVAISAPIISIIIFIRGKTVFQYTKFVIISVNLLNSSQLILKHYPKIIWIFAYWWYKFQIYMKAKTVNYNYLEN